MLSGVRVLDFSRVVAGPICGRILADCGADVIKVEPPEGDAMVRASVPQVDGMSAYFTHLNAGKRSICVDLEDAGQRERLHGLVATADVLLENFRPGILARYGFGPVELAERHPRLVYCSISGYGADGPWRDRRAFAPVVHGEAGFAATVARLHDRPIGPLALSYGDIVAGLAAVGAINGALYERERTGRGQHLDVSLAEAVLFANEFAAPELAGQSGPATFGGASSIAVRTADGEHILTQGNPVHTFPQWARAFGHHDLLEQPRYRRVAEREHIRDELIGMILAWVSAVPDFETLEARVGPERIAVGRVRTVAEVADTDWAAARRVFTEVSPGLTVPRAAFRSSAHDFGASGPPPKMGEHTAELL